MAIQKRIIGRVPVNRGVYVPGTKYFKQNIVQMYHSSFMSKEDDNTTAPASLSPEGFVVVNEAKWEIFADATNSERAAVLANEATSKANEATQKTTQAIADAKQATSNANTATEQANAARDGANSAKEATTNATQESTAQTALAKEATTQANAATDLAKKEIERLQHYDSELVWSKLGNPPAWFRDILKFYYNPFRQGLTNDQIKPNQTFEMTDFSPNGLNMTMSGFDGKGMSGMDGYCDDYSNFIPQFGGNLVIEEKTSNRIIVRGGAPNDQSRTLIKPSINNKKFKIRVEIPIGCSIIYRVYSDSMKTIAIFRESGIFDVPFINEEITTCYYAFDGAFTGKTAEIELIPYYEGAIFFDGKNDKGVVQNVQAPIAEIVSNEEGFPASLVGTTLTIGEGRPCKLAQMLGFSRKLTQDEKNWVRKTYMTNADQSVADLESDVKDLSDKVDAIENRVSNIVGYYGVERPRTSGESILSTDPNFNSVIGRADLQLSHPILGDYKIGKVKDGVFVGELNQATWNYMKDGSMSNVLIDGFPSVDDGSDVMFCNRRGFYAILGGDNPDFEIHAVGYEPFSHRGVVAQWIPPYGDCPDYSVIKDGLQRSIRDNSVAGSNGAGKLGIAAYNEKGYPTTSVSRFNYELYARKKNTADRTDNKQNIPYANAFQLDRMVWATLLFIKFKTKDLHKHSLLGEAISCNDGTVSEETWLHKSGMRSRASEAEPWKYSGLVWDAEHWGGINNYRPLLKMFDAQLALSHAYENKIAPEKPFSYDGVTYQYSNVKGCKGLQEGEMTAIVTKLMKTADGNTEVCLVQPIVCGKVVGWGNVYTWTSGIECAVNDEDTYDVYQTNDVTKLPTDNNPADINEGEKFPFESTMDKLGTVKIGSGYSSENFNNSMMAKTFGGGLHTGECQYNWYTSKATVGKRARRGALFGMTAVSSTCALCSASAANSPSHSASVIGGGFRVSLTEPQLRASESIEKAQE